MTDLLQEPAVRVYAICAAILVLKMALTGSVTGMLRVRRGVFITPEDYALLGKAPQPADEVIERLRRAHQNDLENILPFLVVAFLFALTPPSYGVVLWNFAIFTAARVAHTIVYAAGLQPWRTIFYEIGQVVLFVITIWLLVRVA